MVMELNWSY